MSGRSWGVFAIAFSLTAAMAVLGYFFFGDLLLDSWSAKARPAPHAAAEVLTIAAASDLNPALDELAGSFRARSRVQLGEIRITYGSSGNLFAQIANGAPFDLFFSADREYPQRLVDRNLALSEPFAEYAVGRLALWVPATSRLEVEKGIDLLLDSRVRRIAIANPQHAPYGRAAVAALQHFNLHAKVEAKLVMGENVAQAAQFAHTGAAETALIALSVARAPALRNGRSWLVPAEAHPPIQQVAVITRAGVRNPAGAAFLSFLRTPEAAAILQKYGFEKP